MLFVLVQVFALLPRLELGSSDPFPALVSCTAETADECHHPSLAQVSYSVPMKVLYCRSSLIVSRPFSD